MWRAVRHYTVVLCTCTLSNTLENTHAHTHPTAIWRASVCAWPIGEWARQVWTPYGIPMDPFMDTLWTPYSPYGPLWILMEPCGPPYGPTMNPLWTPNGLPRAGGPQNLRRCKSTARRPERGLRRMFAQAQALRSLGRGVPQQPVALWRGPGGQCSHRRCCTHTHAFYDFSCTMFVP